MRYSRPDFFPFQIQQAVEEIDRANYTRPFTAHSTDGELILESGGDRIIVRTFMVSGGTNFTITNEDGTETYIDIDYTDNITMSFDFPMVFPFDTTIKMTSTGGKINTTGFYTKQ